MKLTLDEWIAIQVGRGVLEPQGIHDGIDIYLPTSQPWMEEDMNPNDPTRPCGCEPVPTKPCCDGGDDEED